MPSATRKGDYCTGHGCYPPRPSITGSPNVYTNNRPAIRRTDWYAAHGCNRCIPHPGQLKKGSQTVFINMLDAGRIGDPIDCGSFVAQGSQNVYIGG